MKTFCSLLLFVVAAPLFAQNAPASASPDQSSSHPPPPAPNTAKNKNGRPKDDRLFFALPNLLTVESQGKVPPLTTGQKYKLVTLGSFDPVEFAWYGLVAGISQWANNDSAYGQGGLGYAKRYGEAFGDGTIENYMTGAVLPSLLHEDPRYYQLGKGGFWHRTAHAVRRIFVTPTDSGGNQFNYSEIFGAAVASGISTYSYHPRDERKLNNVVNTWGTQIGYDTIKYVVVEFWPDIRCKLRKPKSPQADLPDVH